MGRECGALQPKDAPALSAKRAWVADPVPEQQPWRFPEDAQGWQRIYRGTGQRRQVKNSVVVDLAPPQWTWLNRAAATQGLSLHEFLSKLIDEAAASSVAEGR